MRAGFKLDVYWKTLHAHGLTKEKLASYDRPIVSEPCFRMGAKEGLIRDLTMYLKTLKAVHSGVELESAIDSCLAPSLNVSCSNTRQSVLSSCAFSITLTTNFEFSLNQILIFLLVLRIKVLQQQIELMCMVAYH